MFIPWENASILTEALGILRLINIKIEQEFRCVYFGHDFSHYFLPQQVLAPIMHILRIKESVFLRYNFTTSNKFTRERKW
jgi:hypothetical protein